ncbi:Tn3 family transposase [Nocardia carnea]|uniref:Tn3 family transposase n=1 Tax=Nocardia carnea TaxID=37328 RepID=UPI002453E6F8|nr:Tn3 family transposase [Nocardia carnea]
MVAEITGVYRDNWGVLVDTESLTVTLDPDFDPRAGQARYEAVAVWAHEASVLDIVAASTLAPASKEAAVAALTDWGGDGIDPATPPATAAAQETPSSLALTATPAAAEISETTDIGLGSNTGTEDSTGTDDSSATGDESGSGVDDSSLDLGNSALGMDGPTTTPLVTTGTSGEWTPAAITNMVTAIGTITGNQPSTHGPAPMISHDGRPTPLGEAIAHYGRIFKTLHILRPADDEPYRREGKARASLVERRHDLARRIYHSEKGEMVRAYYEPGCRRSSAVTSAWTGTSLPPARPHGIAARYGIRTRTTTNEAPAAGRSVPTAILVSKPTNT